MTAIRVLIVDDSAFARKVLREILDADPRIEVVGIARDGLDAMEKIATLTPEVITLDLVMPHLDGLGVLAALPADGPKVVVVSSAGEAVVRALLAGAFATVEKPTALATERLYEMAADVVQAVLKAAASRWSTERVAPPLLPTKGRGVLVIGASTGGPHALTRVLTALPATLPIPVAVVLHMPIGYTQAFAERLNELCALEVVEASDGLPLVAGRVVVGRAGLHLVLESDGAHPRVRFDPLPLDHPHRPSVDVLFSSAATAFGREVLGVVLTGMGDDGLAGSRRIVAAGGSVITQSAASCVVYGMPRCVEEAGMSSQSHDLETMADAIVRRACS